MTRDEARGQSALKCLPTYTAPLPYFVSGDGGDGEKLYDLERKRNDIIRECAKRWAKIAEVSEKNFWTQSLPQALHDLLEAWDTAASIIAAESFLKRHGWKIERPEERL
jgi:hypothetical protein